MKFPVLWSGLYKSQKHLAWLLCSGIIDGRLAAARSAFHMHSADPVELRPLQFSLLQISQLDGEISSNCGKKVFSL